QVDRGRNLVDRAAGTEVEHFEAVLAADLQVQVRGQVAAGVNQLAPGGLLVDVDVHLDRRLGAEVGLVDLQVPQRGAVRTTRQLSRVGRDDDARTVAVRRQAGAELGEGTDCGDDVVGGRRAA